MAVMEVQDIIIIQEAVDKEPLQENLGNLVVHYIHQVAQEVQDILLVMEQVGEIILVMELVVLGKEVLAELVDLVSL